MLAGCLLQAHFCFRCELRIFGLTNGIGGNLSMKKRYDALDGLRALSCIGVVTVHIKANAFPEVGGVIFDKLFTTLATVVFLFMVISSFSMCCGYYDKMIEMKLDVVSFYKKRYQKILPFFAFLCLLDVIMNPSIDSLFEAFANLTLCFGLIPNANISVIGVGWFLGVVFVFYLMFPFFCFLLSNKTRAWCAMVASLIMNYLCREYFQVGRQSIAYSFVFFMAGGMVYIYRDKIMKIPSIKWISLLLFISMVVMYSFYFQSISIVLLIDVFALIYAMSIDGKSILNHPFMRKIGEVSFEIYLCHMVVFRMCEKTHMINVLPKDYVGYILAEIIVLLGSGIIAITFKKIVATSFKHAIS